MDNDESPGMELSQLLRNCLRVCDYNYLLSVREMSGREQAQQRLGDFIHSM